MVNSSGDKLLINRFSLEPTLLTNEARRDNGPTTRRDASPVQVPFSVQTHRNARLILSQLCLLTECSHLVVSDLSRRVPLCTAELVWRAGQGEMDGNTDSGSSFEQAIVRGQLTEYKGPELAMSWRQFCSGALTCCCRSPLITAEGRMIWSMRVVRDGNTELCLSRSVALPPSIAAWCQLSWERERERVRERKNAGYSTRRR
jgi:hypothetical protein